MIGDMFISGKPPAPSLIPGVCGDKKRRPELAAQRVPGAVGQLLAKKLAMLAPVSHNANAGIAA
jgi:hypothetical protein